MMGGRPLPDVSTAPPGQSWTISAGLCVPQHSIGTVVTFVRTDNMTGKVKLRHQLSFANCLPMERTTIEVLEVLKDALNEAILIERRWLSRDARL